MRFLIIIFTVVVICVSALSPGAQAQTPQKSDAKAPIEITADGTLEWQRGQKTFIARKNVRVKQGDISIAAQSLTAQYADGAGEKFDLTKITAEDGVTLKNADAVIRGDKAVYDIIAQNAVVTGNDLSFKTARENLYADDKFTYNMTRNTFGAYGNARLKQINDKGQTTTLRADKLDATLLENGAGARTLKTLEARGNITITTPTETITGQYGIYNAQNKTAKLSGGVIIKRGPNTLQGARADVDLNTNISRIHGTQNATGNTGRVRGVFYPKSQN